MLKEYFIDLSKPEKLSSEQKEKLSQLLASNLKFGDNLLHSNNKIHKNLMYGVPNSNGQEIIILSHSLVKVKASDNTIKFCLLEHSNKSKLFDKGSYGKVKDSSYVFYFHNNELMYKAESNVCKIEKQPTPIVRIPTKTYKKSLTIAQKDEWFQVIKDESNLFNEIYSSAPSNIALASSHSNEFKIKSYLFMPNLGEIPVPKLHFRNLSYGEKLNLILAMIESVKACHEKNILHRDIKPYNFVFRRKDNKIHLVDFGFARKVNSSERFKLDCGTPSYLAPDVYSTYASDIYSLGGCIAEIMGGNNVFKEKNKVDRALMRFKPYYLNELKSYCPTPTLLDKKNIATIKSIIEKMTDDDSQNRGTIQEIYASFKNLQDEFLLNELSNLDENLGKIKADIEADIEADIKTDTQSLNSSNAKIQIKEELLSKIDTLRKNMATNLHLNQISCEKYEQYFNEAFELFHQEKVNKIYEHRNKFVKFFNTLTRPLSFIFGLLSHNKLLTERGFFLTKSSKILINAEKTLTLSQQSVRLHLIKP